MTTFPLRSTLRSTLRTTLKSALAAAALALPWAAPSQGSAAFSYAFTGSQRVITGNTSANPVSTITQQPPTYLLSGTPTSATLADAAIKFSAGGTIPNGYTVTSAILTIQVLSATAGSRLDLTTFNSGNLGIGPFDFVQPTGNGGSRGFATDTGVTTLTFDLTTAYAAAVAAGRTLEIQFDNGVAGTSISLAALDYPTLAPRPSIQVEIAEGVAVPEPGSGVLLALAGAVGLGFVKSRGWNRRPMIWG